MKFSNRLVHPPPEKVFGILCGEHNRGVTNMEGLLHCKKSDAISSPARVRRLQRLEMLVFRKSNEQITTKSVARAQTSVVRMRVSVTLNAFTTLQKGAYSKTSNSGVMLHTFDCDALGSW